MTLRFTKWKDADGVYTVTLVEKLPRGVTGETEVGWVEKRQHPYWVNDRDMRVFLTRRAAAEALVKGHPDPAVRRRGHGRQGR